MRQAASNAVSGQKPGPTLRPGAEDREKKIGSAIAGIAMLLIRKSFPGPSRERTDTIITPVWPCEPLCASIAGGAESLPLPAGADRIWAAVPETAERGILIFRPLFGGQKEKQDKGRGRRWRLRPVTSPRSAGRYGVLRCIKSGVKNSRRGSRLRSQSPRGYCHNEKTGVTRVSSAARDTLFGLDTPPQKLHRMKQR